MAIIYRSAEGADAAAILDYLKIIGGESDNLTFGPEGLPMTVGQETAYLANANADSNILVLVACDGHEIVGNAAISHPARPRMAHRWELNISVRKDHWGQGIGSSLLEQLICYARENGAEVISLTVRSDNARAIGLYHKFGFERSGTCRKALKIGSQYFGTDYMDLYL